MKNNNPSSLKRTGAGLLGAAVAVVVLVCLVWLYTRPGPPPASTPRDYDAIAAEGILRVSTEYNSTGFFVSGDTLSGFHYELMETFARSKGLKTNYLPETSFDKRMQDLGRGACDVIAHELTATGDLKDSLLLTVPLMLSRSVLVQRKDSASEGNNHNEKLIKSLLDLGGKTIHVVKGSPAILRIRNLENEIGDTIYIKEVAQYGSEDLIAMVKYGDIDYAVCDRHTAIAVADTVPTLDISTDISFTQFYSWGVSKQSPALADSLNAWLTEYRKGKPFQKIYRKYYRD